MSLTHVNSTGRSIWLLDDLDLTGPTGNADVQSFYFETMSEKWALGTPEADRKVLSALAADGDDEYIERYGNRTVPFLVTVVAQKGRLGAGERTLMLRVGRSCLLRFIPPDELSPTVVFEVRTSTGSYEADDLDLLPDAAGEVRATYLIEVRAMPFTRPEDPDTTTLGFGTIEPTVVDACAATTGWTMKNYPDDFTITATTPAEFGGETSLKVHPIAPQPTAGPDIGVASRRMRKDITFPATPYLAIDAGTVIPPGDSRSRHATPNLGSGIYGFPLRGSQPLPNGMTRYFYDNPFGGTTRELVVDLKVTTTAYHTTSADSYLGGVYGAVNAPGTGLMVVDVGGSQRAPFSLHLASEAVLTRATVFADPAMLKFGYNPKIQATWANAPGGKDSGTYTFLLLAGGVAGTKFQLIVNGQSDITYSDGVSPIVFEHFLGALRSGRVGALAISLFVNDVDQTAALVSGTSAYLRMFRNGNDTSLVHIPSGLSKHFWVDSPTIDADYIGLWTGATDADGTSVTHLAQVADKLLLSPPQMGLFIDVPDAAYTAGMSAEVTAYRLSNTFVEDPDTGLPTGGL